MDGQGARIPDQVQRRGRYRAARDKTVNIRRVGGINVVERGQGLGWVVAGVEYD